uniref:O-fucosyltransferase family protein n=1 Tax=Phaeomonas parva TaxID=124430 RepID=A0A7S1U264_9STRA|mmetsp:Transcript_28353/g.90721  ORF Transcript_28353/g.90721 Transcript_28353/m.90721 type:complete len:577 (+) Transcript_28353:45-1775(+)
MAGPRGNAAAAAAGGRCSMLRLLFIVVVTTIVGGLTFLHMMVPLPQDVAAAAASGGLTQSRHSMQAAAAMAAAEGDAANALDALDEEEMMEGGGGGFMGMGDVDVSEIDRIECADGLPGEAAKYWKTVQEDVAPTWEDITRGAPRGYLTYEPDRGGWNNIRMGMELFAMLAMSTGRTLVLPPSESFYLLSQKVKDDESHEGNRGPKLGFSDFFDLRRMRHQGHVITMQEFLEREAKTGNLGGKPLPGGNTALEGKELWGYLRDASPFSTSRTPMHPGEHILAVAPGAVDVPGDDGDAESVYDAPEARVKLMKRFAGKREVVDLLSDPRTKDKLNWHFVVDQRRKLRWLTHAHTVLFWSDEVQERFWRRYTRDGLRYRDEIICASARAVAHLKELGGGSYASYHIRRGDLQYAVVKIPAEEIVENIRDVVPAGIPAYVGTDERDKSFFDKLKAFHGGQLYFLDDLIEEAGSDFELSPNYYGMMEQLLCAGGSTFVGTHFSTFSGYIARLRGYRKWPSKSNYYPTKAHKYKYHPDKMPRRAHPVWYPREWPTSWERLDVDTETQPRPDMTTDDDQWFE